MKRVLETTRTKNIIKYLNAHDGCLVRKRHQMGYSHEGDPDISGSLYGRHIELEVKQPGNKPTTLQVFRLAEWEAAGAIVGVVHDVDEVLALLFSHNLLLRKAA